MSMQGKALIPFFCLLLASCMNANAGRSSDEQRGEPETEGDVLVEFSVENAAGDATRDFRAGETIRFVFAVRNRSRAPRQLAYTFPPHRVEVLRSKEPVWQAWQGRMFPQVMREQHVPVGERIVFSVEWKTADATPPGSYRVRPSFHGFLQPGGQVIPAEMAEVIITVQQ